MSRSASSFSVAVTLCALALATPVSAQVLGTFRWQFAPYCNTVTLTIQQVGGQFTAHGFDDMCGATRSAPASGTAHLNPDGTVGLGVTVIRADGIAVHLTTTFTPLSPTGTWSDDYGNSGTFAFGAPSPSAGTPRPVTLRGTYGGRDYATGASASFTQVLATISYGRTLAAAPTAHFVANSGVAPPQCPGTAVLPQAAPGTLCVYESSQTNRQLPVLFEPNFMGVGAGRFGALVLVPNTGVGVFGSSGTWAVTLP